LVWIDISVPEKSGTVGLIMKRLGCGSILILIKDSSVTADIGEIRLNEALVADTEKVLVFCPCCESQFRVSVDKKQIPVAVTGPSHFVASALRDEFPDPYPEV
jgi:Fe-S oxidoreductase